MRDTPKWHDIEAWAQEQIGSALQRLETSDTDGDKLRGEIRAFRRLLALANDTRPDPDQIIAPHMAAHDEPPAFA